MLADMETRALALLGDCVWGWDEDRPETVVASLLRDKELSLGIMESFTGGLLASLVADVSESDAFFKGGMISPSAEAAVGLGVDADVIKRYGLDSAESAQAMAEAARSRFKADIGLGLSMAADEEANVNSILAHISSEKGQKAERARWRRGRLNFKRRSASVALYALIRFLRDYIR